MMPGQEPYTATELAQLHDLVRGGAEGDPGEAGEIEAQAGVPICDVCGKDAYEHPNGTCQLVWDWNNAPSRGFIEVVPVNVDPYERYLETRYQGLDEEEAREHGAYWDL